MKTDELIAFNSYGGFNKSGNEYHILNTDTPLPWCNVMANERFGTIISSYGTVYTYFKNSREFKISDWCNDWVKFTPGEEFTGIFQKNYNLIYGFGYTRVLEEEDYIKKDIDIYVSKNNDVKIHIITLENTYGEDKTIDISYKVKPVLGVSREQDIDHILCRENLEDNFIEFKNPYSLEFSNCVSFLKTVCNSKDEITYSYNKDEYSTSINVKIPANKKVIFAIILGCTENGEEDIKRILDSYNLIDSILADYEDTKNYWKKLVTRNFNTGSKYLDIMANGWLIYQTVVCRLFAKSGFYQSGGAIGFRDQLQDTLALISSWPEKTRAQLILHASKQFEKGDVLHWWHEHNSAGIRTYFSDDYLWLPYVLCEYISRTKDYSILEVNTKYLEDKPMGDKREYYDVFLNIDKEASVYEHAKKTILYSLSRINKENGLLDIGDGDWNDGFSNIRGQSVWLTFFMMDILEKFVDVANYMKDSEMVELCKKKRHVFKHSILENAWDGTHFVRAFYENGDVLGSNKSEDCKIDLISQAWAVIAMKDYNDVHDELEKSLKSVEKYLVDKENKIVKLLYPAFDNPKNNPGYIKAYVPGIRENGGQYTHGATWLAKAYFDMNEKEKAIEVLEMINPISHSDSKEIADKYMVEPYVIAADIYSNPEHVGRGGWTWYTGSAGWMYKIIEDYLNK